jgi:bla regulator protein BlaR1
VSGATLSMLWDAAVALTATTLVVLALRPVLRARLGAELAYVAWLAVPLSTLATLAPALPRGTRVGDVIGVAMPSLPGIDVVASAAASGGAWTNVALAAWLVGALIACAAFVVQQRRYVRGLALANDATRDAGVPIFRAHGIHASPATIGAWRPCIALPADFESRYDANERELVLAHERMHVARRDGLANAALVAVRCVFWFDPVVHFASRRFRFDQELACDAAVLRERPNARRAYAEAIFKTQLAVPGLPVGCHWQSSHPLKERILMLKQNRVTRSRLAGAATALVVGLVVFSSYAAQSDAVTAKAFPELEVAPTYARVVRVPYPQAAIDGKVEGDVVVKVHIGADGTVLDAAPDDASPQPAQVLQDAAVASVRQWTFNPGRNAGASVDTWALIPVSFRLDADSAPLPESDGFDVIGVMPEPPKAE